MKERIASTIRHALTSLPAVGAFFLTKGWLTGEEAAQLDAAQVDLLAVLGAVAAAVAARAIMWAVAKWAPALAGLFGDNTPAAHGWTLPLCLGLTAASLGGAALLSLSSCAGMGPVRLTPDGCVLWGGTLDSGERVYVGGCTDERIVAEWTDVTGVTVRGTKRAGSDAIAFEYRAATDQPWIPWGPKAGVPTGPVEQALSEKTAAPPAAPQ